MTADLKYEETDSETDASGDNELSEECEDDRCRGPTPPVWHCVDCDSSYCRYVPFATCATQLRHPNSYSLLAIAGHYKALTNPRRRVAMVYRMRRLTLLSFANLRQFFILARSLRRSRNYTKMINQLNGLVLRAIKLDDQTSKTMAAMPHSCRISRPLRALAIATRSLYPLLELLMLANPPSSRCL